MKTNTKKNLSRKGFTLIELIVSIFIFSLITIAIVSVFVSMTTAHQKARAIKLVKENAEFALNSIAKDVRMGKTESTNLNLSNNLEITRNRDQKKICYRKTANTLDVCEKACSSCAASDYKSLVDLAGTGMSFSSTSGFRNQKTEPISSPPVRGWVEINLNIVPTGGISSIDMTTDAINVQTIVSSRDYGWEEI